MSPTIGVFDSGFGGLTVLRALVARMPAAHYAFIGDTARLPYGSKSQRTIARYAVESAQFLVREQGAEFLVIACNTASALALDAIKEAVPVPVLGVIEPGAEAARGASHSNDVLVIATDATVRSHAYKTACAEHGLRALEKACPLLVPLVEEGWTGLDAAGPDATRLDTTGQDAARLAVTDQVIRIYLDELNAAAAGDGLKPDTLVLGCTHYPLLRPLIERAVPAGMRVIDSAAATAATAAKLILNGTAGGHAMAVDQEAARKATEIRCFATDSVEKFERLGSRFLGRPVGPVKLVDLGG
ncbi:MAG: glutamate racemase [Terracidiphilus sp.]|nr:glutamate racemase [Terracidiphilus sp.]